MINYNLKTFIGIALLVLSTLGLMINLAVVIPVFRLAFIQKKSPIYVISLMNILTDILMLIMATFYMAPSIILETYFFGGKTGVIQKLIGTVFMFCWYFGSITQIIMAVNRLVVICFRRIDLFTIKHNLWIFGIAIPFSMFLAYMAQYGFPCCGFYFDQYVLSYSYNQIEGMENYPNTFIDMPLNFSSSGIAIVCYSIIVRTVHKATKGISSSMTPQEHGRTRRNREVTYAMQFCFISMFYTFSWISFRVFPIIIGDKGLEWFSSISVAVTINSSANALVYLISNQEVRRNLKSGGLHLFRMTQTTSDALHSTDGHSVIHAVTASTKY